MFSEGGLLYIYHMGCSNCGSAANGKPAGCRSNGGCSTGGCNRMNVFDWLSTIPLQEGMKPYNVVEVTFSRGSRKEFFRNNYQLTLQQGDWIIVEGVGGVDMGQVNLTGDLVRYQMKKYNVPDNNSLKKIIRLAEDEDFVLFNEHKQREPQLLTRSRAMANHLKLEMKIGEVEIQADGKKATFFYTADGRVDFRELIKLFAGEFRLKVEMKQIGLRQESGKVGGIGSCGRELCCSTWLTDFKSVNTSAARYQNLSINQTKLSGQCGRLKCCLNYELDTYMDALRSFPEKADALETQKGKAILQKRDIFKNLMWYSYQGSNKQYPLSIEQVKEILQKNKSGEKPGDLEPVKLDVELSRRNIIHTEDVGFVNDVGQESLQTLERASRKKRSAGKGRHQSGSQGTPRQQGKGNYQTGGERSPQRDGEKDKRTHPPHQRTEAQQPKTRQQSSKTHSSQQQQGNVPRHPSQPGRNKDQKSNRPPHGHDRQRNQSPKGDAPQ